jgi:hypothetical protein
MRVSRSKIGGNFFANPAKRGTPEPASRNPIMPQGFPLPDQSGSGKPCGIIEVFGEGSGEDLFTKRSSPDYVLKSETVSEVISGGLLKTLHQPCPSEALAQASRLKRSEELRW